MITRHRSLSVLTLSLLSLPALLAACDDQFTSGSVINRMRLLGAKVFIPSEPDRAWVRPGDSGRVNFSVVFPDATRDTPIRPNPLADVKSMMINCTTGVIFNGQAQCAEVLFLAQASLNPPDADAGADAGPTVSPEQVDATVAALRAGIECGDPTDDERPFKLAQLAIGNVPVTTMSARLECPHDEIGNPLRQLFDVPADYQSLEAGMKLGLPPLPERLVQGVICEYGEPIFKSEAPFFGCRYEIGSNPALPNRAPTAEVFTFTIGIEQNGQSNHHPKFAVNDPIGIANATGALPKPMPGAWLDLPAPAPVLVANPNGGPDKLLDCTTETDPTHIRDYGRKSEVTLAIAADREVTNEDPLRKEAYQVETFATYGELDRQFSIIDDLDPIVADGTDGQKAVISVQWDHGKLPSPARNTLVRFYFLIRDGRGGFEFQTRWMCLCRGGSCQ